MYGNICSGDATFGGMPSLEYINNFNRETYELKKNFFTDCCNDDLQLMPC